MNGDYSTTIKLLNILQFMGWLGMIGGLYAGWRIYSAIGFIEAVVSAAPAVMASMGIMAICQVSGVLIDIARSSRAIQTGLDAGK